MQQPSTQLDKVDTIICVLKSQGQGGGGYTRKQTSLPLSSTTSQNTTTNASSTNLLPPQTCPPPPCCNAHTPLAPTTPAQIPSPSAPQSSAQTHPAIPQLNASSSSTLTTASLPLIASLKFSKKGILTCVDSFQKRDMCVRAP